MANVRDAAKFAARAHGTQRYGSQPYTYHLEQVYKNTVKFGGSDTEQQAGWLHDVIEDTSVTRSEVAKAFGGKVAQIVDLVSNRASKEATFKRVRTDRSAVFVKLCDRLANVSVGSKNSMYRKHHPVFKEILYRKGEFEALWRAIDKALGL